MDLRTLFFVEASLLVLFGLTMVVNSIGQPWQRGTFYFAASNFSGAIGLILHSYNPAGPRLINMVLGNLFLFLELVLINKSIAEYVQRARNLWLYLLGFILFMSLLSLPVIFVYPSFHLRLAIISSVIVVTSIASAFLLFRYPAPGARAPTLVMGTLFILYTTTNAIRLVQIWWDSHQSFYHIWLDRTLVAGLSFGYLWMTAARLRLDLEQQASTDSLTGTLNRRALERATQPLFERYRLTGHTTSALMLDVDFFKTINDTFGHHSGDLALCAIAHSLRLNTRPTDLIARLGGDEFLVILPETPNDQAHQIAERLRACFASIRIPSEVVPSIKDFGLRASIGVISLDSQHLSLEAIMKLGDHALYQAKANSRIQHPLHPPANFTQPQTELLS